MIGSPTVGGEDAKPEQLAGNDEPEPEADADADADAEDVIIDDARVQRNIPLEGLLRSPELYSGELVSLEQVYCVGGTAARLPDGLMRLALIESNLELTNGESWKLTFADRAELEVDRKLAEQLVRLGKVKRFVEKIPDSPDWDIQPAIVTLRVFDRPLSRTRAVGEIVKLEFIQKIQPEIKGNAKKVLFVRYLTRTVTPDGDTMGRGNAEDWSKPKKLGYAKLQLQKYFDAVRKQVGAMRARSNAAMLNSMISQGLGNTIRQDAAAAVQRRQQALNPFGR